MENYSYRDIASLFGVRKEDVSAVAALHGLEPSKLGRSFCVTPRMLEIMRSDLERVAKARKRRNVAATAAAVN